MSGRGHRCGNGASRVLAYRCLLHFFISWCPTYTAYRSATAEYTYASVDFILCVDYLDYLKNRSMLNALRCESLVSTSLINNKDHDIRLANVNFINMEWGVKWYGGWAPTSRNINRRLWLRYQFLLVQPMSFFNFYSD